MSALDVKIDDLYRLPLTEFTSARNALARTVKGADAARVKRLPKPSLVPWAVNQLYWRERRTWDRLLASGRALRSAQIAALEGRGVDLRGVTAEHRTAVGDALATSMQLAAASDAHPAAEPLSRMLEALSLTETPPKAPGRFSEVLQPAGFEALAGVTPLARALAPAAHAAPPPPHTTRSGRRSDSSSKAQAKQAAVDAAAERKRAEAAAAARKAAESAVRVARHQVQRAQAAEARAQAQVDALQQQIARAEAAVREAHTAVVAAQRDLARAEAELAKVAGRSANVFRMHDFVLILHSWVRWVAIIAGLLATATAFGDAANAKSNRWGLIFTIALDIQFLLGLILLLTLNVFSDFGATMRDPIARFYTVEHETIMVIAIALAHMGRVLARKALTPASARTRSIVFFGISTLLLLVGTPWPGTRDNRPLFRL